MKYRVVMKPINYKPLFFRKVKEIFDTKQEADQYMSTLLTIDKGATSYRPWYYHTIETVEGDGDEETIISENTSLVKTPGEVSAEIFEILCQEVGNS